MRIRILTGVDGARAASGDVVIIDVLRAFTTAAFAFASGLEEIEIVATVDEAFARPGFRLGEVGGALIPGFDHDNSPSRLAGRRLSGRGVLRTSSGTQGVVEARNAQRIWLASLVVASATARALRGAEEVSLVAMGGRGEPAEEEDMAAALVIAAALEGRSAPVERAIEMVRESHAARMHDGSDPHRPPADVDCSVAIDAFDFAMRAERSGERILARVFRPAD